MLNKNIVRLVLSFLFLFLFQISYGQGLKIKVKNRKNQPLYAATVRLFNIGDSTTLNTVTSEAGIADFKEVINGLYKLNISYVGFAPFEKTITVKSERRSFDFTMTEQEISLDEVTVTAKRPMITQEDDKMIIDPEPIASTSTNTLEVLENTPGIYVDQDGGIFLSSSSTATIYINGREQKMSNQDIATLLRSLPPGSVQRIEVMRTPSTKYDASSSGGIVNIILKKGVKIGRFSSVNLGMNQGKYGNRFAGFSINNSGEKSTTYLNVNLSYNDSQDGVNMWRQLMSDTSLSQHSTTRNTSRQGYVGYGLNYDLTEKWAFTYDGRVNLNFPTSKSSTTNLIEGMNQSSLFVSDNLIVNENQFYNIQQDIGLNKKIDTIGSNWDFKASYNYSKVLSEQDNEIVYQIPISFRIDGDGTNLQRRNFVLFQTDLTYQFPKKLKLETGAKSTFQRYQSDASFFFDLGGSRNLDSNRTNAFAFNENINAAYVQLSKTTFLKLLIKTGVRVEHTYMDGQQTIPVDTNFLINRVDWFPYLYISRALFKIADFELRAFAIYRKTINRPDYQSLNPYKKYIDQFQYEAGNPNLQPQFTDNIEINISFDDTPLFAIGRNYTTDIFANVIYKDVNNERIIVRTFDNIGKSRETYFRGMAGIPPGGRYFFGLGAQYNLNEYDGMYENKPLKYTRGTWRFFTFHSLKLFKETKLTVSGFAMVNGMFNFYELEPFGQVNIGLNQTLFNKKMTITLNMRDVFKTMKTVFTINQGGIISSGDRYSDSQRFGINLRYNFGVKRKEVKKGFMELGNEE